jgi:hypothetical protein
VEFALLVDEDVLFWMEEDCCSCAADEVALLVCGLAESELLVAFWEGCELFPFSSDDVAVAFWLVCCVSVVSEDVWFCDPVSVEFWALALSIVALEIMENESMTIKANERMTCSGTILPSPRADFLRKPTSGLKNLL